MESKTGKSKNYQKNRGEKNENIEMKQDLDELVYQLNRYGEEEEEEENEQEDYSNVNPIQELNLEEQKQDFEIKISQIQAIVGGGISKKRIKNALRWNNMKLEETILELITKEKDGSSSSSASVSPIKTYSTMKSSSNLLEKQAFLKAKYVEELKQVQEVLYHLSENIIVEELEINKGNVEITIINLSEEGYVRSLCVCIEEHKQDLNEVDDHLEEILEKIRLEEEQTEF